MDAEAPRHTREMDDAIVLGICRMHEARGPEQALVGEVTAAEVLAADRPDVAGGEDVVREVVGDGRLVFFIFLVV